MFRLHKYFSLPLCAVAATVAVSTGAHAAVLYSQDPTDGGDAYDSTYSIAQAFGFENAESYTVSATSSVTGFRWWGTAVSDTSHFVVRRFDDVDANPDTFDILAGTVTATPTALIDSIGTAITQFDLTLATSISAGGYLSVFFDSDPAQESWYWLESMVGDGNSAVRSANPGTWDILPPDLSLAVIGESIQTVSEPGSLTLLGIAALAGVASRRRRPA